MNTFFYKDIAYPDGVIGGKDYYNPVIYSTNERLIGVWADNKPLYQKTVVFGSVSGTAASLPLNIANVDKIFLCADASSVNGAVPLSYVTGTNYNNNIGGFFDVAANNTNFEIRIGADMAGNVNSVIITAQYTKTTDTAGSAPYNNNGVPTVRYSTDEQIIGLWADGKPLYRRVLTNIDNTPQNYWIDLGNVEEWNIINIYGMATFNDSNYQQVIPIPNYNNVNANYYTRLYYITNGANAISGAPSNPIIWVENGSDQVRYYTIINHLIMEYTKTTD